MSENVVVEIINDDGHYILNVAEQYSKTCSFYDYVLVPKTTWDEFKVVAEKFYRLRDSIVHSPSLSELELEHRMQ